jgi:tyrosine-protein kinase Etk/Wzc
MTPTRRNDVALEVVAGPDDRTRRALPPAPVGDAGFDDGGDDGVSLTEYVDVLVEGRWLIGAIAAVAVVLGGAYAFVATPIYRSDVLVQVEQKKGGMGGLDDLSGLFGESSPAETEIEILRSRSLIGQVVDQLKLDVVAEPRRFPLFGKALAKRHTGDEPAGAFLGFGSYGWGGERLAVQRLEVSPRWADLEEPLALVAGEGGAYVVRAGDQDVVTGQVGKAAEGNGVALFVSELRARPGTEFAIAKLSRDEVVAGFQRDLRIAEKGKKTGVLQLALEGPDRARLVAVLDALSQAYLRQNVERKSAEAEKTLAFLETQLPELKGTLDAAEAELESYRTHKGSIDVSFETQAAVTRSVEVEKAMSELQVESASLRQRFTDSHPMLVAISSKLAKLQSERALMEERMRKLPEAELESARRMRDVQVANELYLTLLNKAQELKVIKSGTIGTVRILDAAILPAKPVKPKKPTVLALSLFLGLALGVAAAFGRRALDHGVDDPDQVERAIGVPVYASVPHSTVQEEAVRKRRRGERIPILAASDPGELAIESLRSLRTSLQFALLEAKNQIVTIGGAAPGVGKSFVAANLGQLLAEGGKRVLVVDGDLRRGHLQRYFGGEREQGLSEAIRGSLTIEQAVRPTETPGLFFLSTGTLPPNPAELLGSDHFSKLLGELGRSYDHVLVDLPPVLAVTDGAIVARAAGVNLVVLKAGEHPMREIQAAMRQFVRNGVRVHGFVMNDVVIDRGLGRRSAYHYQYSYK